MNLSLSTPYLSKFAILKGMKKITFLLLLPIFLFGLITPVFATNCCSDGYFTENGEYCIDKNTKKLGGLWQCQSDERCNITSNACVNKNSPLNCVIVSLKQAPDNTPPPFKVGEIFSAEVRIDNAHKKSPYQLTVKETQKSWNQAGIKYENQNDFVLLFGGLKITTAGNYTLKVDEMSVTSGTPDTCSSSLSIIPHDPDCPKVQKTFGPVDTYWNKDLNCCQTQAEYGPQYPCNPGGEPYCANPSTPATKDEKGKFVCTSYDPAQKQYDYHFSAINLCDDKTTIGIQTAIGCIPTGKLPDFLSFVLRWVFGISGGIILMMLIFTGYGLLTSAGNPEKLQAVKENIISLISGLALIIFSLVLLQAIGVNILALPGFTSP